MSDLLAGIRDRRQATTSQALGLLAGVPAADLETRRSLLSMAGRYLADPDVLARWVELASVEADPDLKAQMVQRVANADQRQLQDVASYIDLMVTGLASSRLRTLAVNALNRLVVGFPQAVDALREAYAGQPSDAARERILVALCQVHRPNGPLTQFLAAEADRCRAATRALVVDRLLRTGSATEQTLSDWLSPAQPEAVKRRVLDYVLDRALALVEPLARAARSDEVPGVRAMAVRCLATRSGRDATALAALMDVAGHDPRAECRAEAVQALRAFTDPSPQALATLVEALGTEKDVDLSRLLISVLLPYAATEGTVRQALMDVAASNPRAELAGPIVEALGELLRWGPELLPWFLAVYRGATSDQVKATALAALAGGAPGDERLYQIYAEATASPDPRIRSWGILGLLMVPMTEDRASLMAAGAPALTVPSVDVGLRRALARKLACLPTPPEGLRVALEQAAAGADDGTIRQICRQALSRAPAEAGAGRAELERWHHQVDVDEDVSGIFPDVFAFYGAAPALAAEVLKTCVLNPACRDKLYYQRYQVNDILIMQFLAVHGAFDDDLCRYCAAQVTGSQGPSAYLAMLRWRPSYPGLRDMVWQALESAAHPSGLNHRLLLEVMVLAHGSDEAAAAALEERLGRLGSPTAAARYMRFLDDIHFWPPAERVISGLLSSGRLLDEANTQALKATITDLFPGFASLAAGTGPGLADG